MVDESSEGGSGDYERQFKKMELQVVGITLNILILMVALESKFGPFSDFGGYNSDIRS